ncbi:hypothetical protein PHMEG_00015074 [Phytophthora megakarya]|uniref:Uncharacterized protein n=1 Tax=Phytophthora megakarya TaxID=4795 RepID=A0A225W2C7_9STRA|nr:hypothetical protein PHMEG_00015074 [Phytophthora megakarya]
MSDVEAARTPNTPFVASPFELQKRIRPLFSLREGRPAIPTPLITPGGVSEQKTSPPAHLRRLEGGIARSGGPGVSPMGNQEQKSPVLNSVADGQSGTEESRVD